MKVLTLHQPWASLVALGVKSIETRSWSTSYRGPLAMHAGLSKIGATQCSECWAALYDALRGELRGGDEIPLGAIVATCMLVDVVPMVDREAENEAQTEPRPRELWVCGDDPLVLAEWNHGWTETYVGDQQPYGLFEPGRYAWLLADVVPVDPPVAFKGGQGLTKTWEP